MINPFTDALEWWDEQHWLRDNYQWEYYATDQYSFPAVVFKIQHKALQIIKDSLVIPIIYDAINTLYSERTKGHAGILWSFNNHPKTSFEDIKTVLLYGAEKWRRAFGTTT